MLYPYTKISITNLIKQAFEGKTLVSSEFINVDDGEIYDAMGNKLNLEEFNPFGKIIQKAEVGWSSGREDVGLLFYFEGYSDPFFFYENEDISVSN